MENYECEYCNNVFTNKTSLKVHQKNAKYCLKIQNKDNAMFMCSYCNKQLSTKNRLITHVQVCEKVKEKDYEKNIISIKNSYEEKITILEFQMKDQQERYERQIKELQDKLENVAIKAAERPTIQNNNRISQIINNLQPLKMEDFKHHTQYLTLDHIKDGASGYAKYALEYPLKDKVICVDYARRKVKYKDENGNLVNDPEMTKISQKFFTDIEESNNSLIKEYNKIILEKMISVNEGTEEISEEEAERCLLIGNQLMDEMMRVKNIKHGIDEIKNGKKPDLLHDFVKDVCSKTTC